MGCAEVPGAGLEHQPGYCSFTAHMAGPGQGQHTARLPFPFPTLAGRPSWGAMYLLSLLMFRCSFIGSRLPSGSSHTTETWLGGREALLSQR